MFAPGLPVRPRQLSQHIDPNGTVLLSESRGPGSLDREKETEGRGGTVIFAHRESVESSLEADESQWEWP